MSKRKDTQPALPKLAPVEWMPSFEGTIEFDFTVDVIGHRSTRRARVEYSLTPSWEHCTSDGRLGTPQPGGLVGFNVLTRRVGVRRFPDSSVRHVEEEIGWEASTVFESGHVDDEVWHAIDRMIEERCQREDVIRREAFKLPPGDYPPFERGIEDADDDPD